MVKYEERRGPLLARRLKLLVGVCLTIFTVSCGKSDKDAPGGDDSSDGGAGGELGDGDALMPTEPGGQSLAPVFGGVSAGSFTGEGVTLEWYAAADDETAVDDLVYLAYAGVDDGPVNLSRPVAVSLPGADSLVITGLDPADYRFVVRVRDEDGNEDDNIAAVRVSTLDQTPPVFAGVVGAIAEGAGHFRVEWRHASDDTTPFYGLRYRIYRGQDHDSVFDGAPVDETEEGAVSALVPVVTGWPQAWFGVRAVDESGNEDENERATLIVTPDGVGPRFAGLLSAVATRSGVLLSWPPATEEISPTATPSNLMRYRVFYSKTSKGQDLSRPSVISEAGVTQVLVTGLELGTEYFFMVRAVDEDGNTDTNTVEKSVETLPLDEVPPVFEGVKNVQSLTPTSLNVGWSTGTDTETASAQLRYQIFVAESADDFDYDAPTSVTPPGRLSGEVLGLDPDTDYSVLVRAVDQSGNVSDSEVVLVGRTLAPLEDMGPPTLSGGAAAALVPSDATRLLVTWSGAQDDTSVATGLRGHVCVGASLTDCQGQKFFQNYNATGTFGASSVFVSGLRPRTSYYVAVRLEDEAGNYGALHQAPGLTATSFSTNVEPILTVRCNQCHSYTYGTIVNVFEDEYQDPVYGDLYLVDTNNVTESYLLRKLRPSFDEESPFSASTPAGYQGDRMPSDGSAFLTPAVEQVIIDWIDQGAFFN